MTAVKLTNRARRAHKPPMDRRGRARIGLMVMLGAGLAGGCVSVNAPDKPIVIELNINIKQEVIYRLAADAGNTIDQNADIF
ncbi:YnbE family lipoprotein [Tsuneonella sp. HG222]